MMDYTEKKSAQVMYAEEVTSTNEYLAQLCTEQEVDNFTTLLTDFQTAGKGQRGNFWESERGKNLLFSTLFYPKTIAAGNQFILSMIASTTICSVLAKYVNQEDLSIKWPNDIYWKDKKIAGILIENDLTGDQITQSIVGIGVNINQKEFHSSAPNPVSLYQLIGKETDLIEVLSEILRGLVGFFIKLEDYHADTVIALYQFYKTILYRSEGFHPYRDSKGEFMAEFNNVESDGHLVLKDENGNLRRYAFKEVEYLL